jgi:hypothetical protein
LGADRPGGALKASYGSMRRRNRLRHHYGSTTCEPGGAGGSEVFAKLERIPPPRAGETACPTRTPHAPGNFPKVCRARWGRRFRLPEFRKYLGSACPTFATGSSLTAREGDFRYHIPLRPGIHELHLHFAETVHRIKRVSDFGVDIARRDATIQVY